jgi:hypothetical protein
MTETTEPYRDYVGKPRARKGGELGNRTRSSTMNHGDHRGHKKHGEKYQAVHEARFCPQPGLKRFGFGKMNPVGGSDSHRLT